MTEPLFIVLPQDHDGAQIGASTANGNRATNGVFDLVDTPVSGVLNLPEPIRRHALSALRLQRGDQLQLSDGRGLRIHARVLDAADGTVGVQAIEHEPAPAVRIALVQALAKQGHDEQAIDAATQIGVDALVPWQANRSIAKWKRGKSERKWMDTLLASSEQSRRSWVPTLEPCVNSGSLETLCERATRGGNVVLVLHQDADSTLGKAMDAVRALACDQSADDERRTVFIVVGPEGGIDDDEVRALSDSGALCCVIGRNILRASTAGPVAVTLVSEALGRLQ